MVKVLVTGFEPFGDEKINASWKAVSELPDRIDNIEIIKLEIPVVVYKSVQAVLAAAEEHSVDAIISVGESGASPKVEIELIGTNWLDMSIPDNDGNSIVRGLSYPDGPDAHFARIPAAKIAKSVGESLPVSLSLSAGSYVCNHLLYGVLQTSNHRAGFVHVPTTEQQNKGKSMPLDAMVECLRAIVGEVGAVVKS